MGPTMRVGDWIQRTGLAVALLVAAAAAAPAEAGPRFWRPQRQLRSLESGDALGARLFPARQRRSRPSHSAAAPTDARGVDVGEWLSRYGEIRQDAAVAPRQP